VIVVKAVVPAMGTKLYWYAASSIYVVQEKLPMGDVIETI
jgi:hypothetical protein